MSEAEARRQKIHDYLAAAEPIPNGLACKRCGAETVDEDRRFLLLSSPPRYRTNCPKCGQISSRFA